MLLPEFFVLALSEELWEEHPEQGLPRACQAAARQPSWMEARPQLQCSTLCWAGCEAPCASDTCRLG